MVGNFAEIFAANYLVFGLPKDKIEEIAAMAVFETLGPGASVVSVGDKSSDLFVILDGTVLIHTKHGDKLAEAGAGSVIGEVALVDDQPRCANVTTKGSVCMARLPATELRAYMARNREVGFLMLANLARVLSMRLRNLDQVVEGLFGKARDPWDLAT
jgi:CRP/FNR family transcriptional regulator